MKDPLVSVIIITRNRPFLLRCCIECVLGQPYSGKEIIVVDSSFDEESELVVAKYPEVKSVRLRGQRNNMPQARNAGMVASSGDIIAFIDDDAMVQPGWLESLVDAYLDETVGAAGGRVIDMPAPYCDQVSGPPRLFIRPSGRVISKDAGLVSRIEMEVDHLIGCNMSFRRQALEQVGGFDPNYTLTNLREETDICIRVKKAGWRIVFRPPITVIHFSARSLQPHFLERPSIQFSNGRNCTYFAIKNFGLNRRTVTEQFIIDTGRCCGRAIYLTLLFTAGMVAHIVGRFVGLVVGISWHVSSRRRVASAPKIERRDQSFVEREPLPVVPQSELPSRS